jgi:hypothetical protein
MTTTLSYLPYDIIWQVGKYLDYDSSINFNRILDPLDRIVHRKFTKQECFEHEVFAQRQTLLIATTKCMEFHSRTTRQRRKRCKSIIDMLKMMRIQKRGSIVWKLYPQFYTAVSNKCDEILDQEGGFLDLAPPYYKKWLTKVATDLKMDIENKMPQTYPKKLVTQIEIEN